MLRSIIDSFPPRLRPWLPVIALAALAAGVALGLAIVAPRLPAPAVAARPSAEKPAASTSVTAAPVPVAAVEPTTASAPKARTMAVGFYVNWDQAAYDSLAAHIDEIDVLMPMWYHVGNDGSIALDDPGKQAAALELIRRERPDLKVMPIVNNYDKPSERWNAPQVGKLLAKPVDRTRIAKDIVTTLDAAGFDGVNIDFEEFTEADRANLVAFMAELRPLAKEAGLEVSQDVLVASKAYDHAALAKHVDYLIPMMYGEHWRTSGPGPIASQGWYDRTLAKFLAQVPADKVVVGLGVYGRDWGTAGETRSRTYAQAAADAHAKGIPIAFDATQLNSRFNYAEGSDRRSVWILDAFSVFDQVASASKSGVRGYAIWRMGAEDPAVWTVLRSRDALDAKVAASLGGGKRTVVYDEKRGLIVSATVAP